MVLKNGCKLFENLEQRVGEWLYIAMYVVAMHCWKVIVGKWV